MAGATKFSMPSCGLLNPQRLVYSRSIKCCRSARACSEAANAVKRIDTQPHVLANQLITLVDGTDRGAALDKQVQSKVANIISKLEELSIPSQPLQSPLIFGEWNVDYCSNPTAPGGYYRSAIGRVVFKTKEMVQTIDPPDVVKNKVSFAALGFINGEVSLEGKLTALDDKWIEIEFEAARLKIGPFELGYGGKSRVKIAVLYLDDNLRLGRGSRGSLFVFTRRS